MSSFIIDSTLFRDQVGTAEMRQVFSDETMMQNWLDCWAALAEAEAEVGLVPEEAARRIRACAKWQNINFQTVREGFQTTDHPLMPQIREFTRVCGPEAGGYIHWGATTQDIMDTGVVLSIKRAYAIFERDTKDLIRLALEKAVKYRGLAMAGRTHGQHAVPITLGYKFAIWADEFGRTLTRLEEGKDRILQGQLAGAAGTLASFGRDGLTIQEKFCHKLGLAVPTITWHVARDSYAEFAADLAILAGTVGIIANEIINLQRTEIGEIEESAAKGRVGSSTMPQKRNPMTCENITANVRVIQQDAELAFGGMLQEHERDMTFWQAEWSYIPQMCIMLAGSLNMLENVFRDMVIHEDRIRENLHSTHGLIVAERCMLELGRYLGRQNAHDVLHDGCMKAFEEKRHLLDVLLEDPRVTSKLDKALLEELLDPDHYTGSCGALVDRVYNAWKDKVQPIGRTSGL